MTNDRRRRIEGIAFLIAYGLTIPAANWLIGHVGTVCAPNRPCLIPVAPNPFVVVLRRRDRQFGLAPA